MKKLLSRNIPFAATIAVCILLYAVAAVLYKNFATSFVFVNFFADNSFLGIIAVGMTLVIISGGIDLSVGALMALCTVIMAVLMSHWGIDPGVSIAITLVIGTFFGFVMGSVIHYLKLAPFIVTLAGMFLARGLAQIVAMKSVPIQNSFYDRVTEAGLSLGSIFIPLPALILLGMVGLGIYLSTYTPFGRNLYAIGGNEDAALLMGLPIGKTKLLVYAFNGFCAALAGVVLTFYQSAGDASAGVGLELDAIAVVVIGGTLLTGGSGLVMGTLVGTLIYGIIQTGITFQGTLNSSCARVAVGLLLLTFIILQKLISRKAVLKN